MENDRYLKRAEVEEELLAGHQKSWVNVHTGENIRLSQSLPRPDHDMFLGLNAERMGVDLSSVEQYQLSRVLQAKSRAGDFQSSMTIVAGNAGWVRVHRNTRMREINIDALNASDALIAARIAVLGMRAPRNLSLDLMEGINGHGKVKNMNLHGNEVSDFLNDGLLPDGHGGTLAVMEQAELPAAGMSPR